MTSKNILPALCVLFFLSGCDAHTTHRAESAEKILEAEGPYKLVEQEGETSPEEKHMQTRGKVNPAQISSSKSYTKDVRKAHVKEETHVRVLKMERDIDAVKKEFKGLKDTLENDDVKLAQVTKKSASKSVANVEPSSGGNAEAVVKAVRVGAHPGKTRMVLDLSAPIDAIYELDNARKLLVIKLPGAAWDTAAERVLNESDILQAYAAKTTADGALIAVKLDGPAKILSRQKLGKGKNGHYRVFVDVAKL